MTLRWVRWLFAKKGLDEILGGFEAIYDQLEEYQERNEREMNEKRAVIEQLQAAYDQQDADGKRARIVQANIHAVLTQQLATEHFDQENV